MKKMKLFVSIALILFCFGEAVAQKTNFTISDALKVKSFGNQNWTDDGKYLMGFITDGSSRFDTDHFRYRDPSYNNFALGELVILNVNTGEEIRPYNGRVKASGFTWSPNHNELAFFEQKGEKLHLMVYDVAKKRLRELKIAENPLFTGGGLQWTNDGKSIMLPVRENGWLEKAMALYTEATVGPVVVYDSSKPFLKWDEIANTNALNKVVMVDVSNAKMKPLLPESNYSGIQLSNNGQFLIYNETFPLKTSYTRNDNSSEFQVAYRNMAEPDSVKYLHKRSKTRKNFNFSESKTRYAYIDSNYVFVQSLGKEDKLNLTKGKAWQDEEKKKEVRFSIMSWSPQDNHLLLSSDKGYWLAAVDGSAFEMVYELPEDKDNAPTLRMIYWSPDEKQLYFSTSAKDKWERGLHRLDLATKTMTELKKGTDIYSGIQFSKDGTKVIFSLSDGDAPGELMIANADFSDAKPLLNLNGWMKDKKLTRSELITYRNVDGKELKGILYYPVDYEPGKKYPLVCEIYEGFFENGYNRNMNLFANQGYFVLRPSVDLEMGYPGEAWVKGITAAINKLVDEGKVDNDKVGVQGGSYGGYATSLLITQTNRFAAAINISGKVNIISFLGDSPKIGTRNYSAAEEGQDRIGGTLWDEPLKYLATTAVLYADRIKTPHMIMTGEGDWNVPGTNSRELYYAMRRLGKEVIWVNYMLGGHGAGAASNESDFYDHWNRVFEFYDKHFNKKDKKEEPAVATASAQNEWDEE